METEDVLTLLKEVAEEVITPRFRALAAHDIAEKNPGDLVTIADRESEERITAGLLQAYPDALVLGEEATAGDPGLLEQFRSADHAFTVDPVDGTKNFVNGSPDHAVMVAEVRGGEVVRSWIWQPQHEKAYVAERGAGAWCNGAPLVRPPRGDAPRGVTSRRGWIGRALGALQALEVTWTCCGVDYPKIVEGAADYALYRRPKPWDHAPGSLLLPETGGYVGSFDGSPYRPQADPPLGIVPAGERATYDVVQGLVHALPGLSRAVTACRPGCPEPPGRASGRSHGGSARGRRSARRTRRGSPRPAPRAPRCRRPAPRGGARRGSPRVGRRRRSPAGSRMPCADRTRRRSAGGERGVRRL